MRTLFHEPVITPPSRNWDRKFVGLAHHISSWSKDPSTKVGAVIVGDRQRVLSLGYNGFPRGIRDLPSRLNDRPLKYQFTAHAERNALDQAECSVHGATIYVTAPPCAECAKSIIQRSIARVVATEMDRDFMARWAESFAFTSAMFAEAGVSYETFPLGDVP